MTARALGWLGTLLLAGCTLASIDPRLDPDLLHGLTLAREWATTGTLPRHDVFAYTPTRPVVVHHEWLAGTIAYLVVERFGAPGLSALALVLESVLVAGALGLAWTAGARLPVMCLLAPLGIVLLAPGLTTLRAQVWSLLGTVGVLAAIALDRRGRRWWIAPFLVLHVAWLNLHGGFVIGLGLLGLHGIEQWLRGRAVAPVALAILAGCVLTIVNPYGTAYVAYLWEALRMDRSLIGEWRPLGDGYPAALVAWGLSVLVVAYAAGRLGPAGMPGLLLVAVTALLALRYQRHVSIYAVVWLVQVPAWIARTALGALVVRWWTGAPRATAAVLAVAVAWSGARAWTAAPWRLRVPARPGEGPIVYPTGAVAWLEAQGFRGALMTPFDVGAYVSWHAHPAVRVSLDGRYEAAYAPGLLVDHAAFYAALPQWAQVRARHPPDAVLVPAGAPVAAALQAEGTWNLLYDDGAYRVYGRPGLALPGAGRAVAPDGPGFP